MKPHKSLLWIGIFLLLSTCIYAVPPFTQTSTSLTGLQLETPKFDKINSNTNLTIHTHIYNQSNGVPKFIEPSCFFHLYDTFGIHTMEAQMINDDNLQEKKLFISASNLTTIGTHTYILWCNITSKQVGGYVSGTFEVINSTITEQPTDSQTSIYITSIIFFGFAFLLSLIGAIGVKGSNNYKIGDVEINYGKYLKLFMIYSAYFTAWVLVFFTELILEKYFTMTFITSFLKFVFEIMGIGNVVILPLLFFIAIADWIADRKLLKEFKRNLPPR